MASPASPLVLVVDDHLDTCEILVRLLRLASYRAVCANGGQEALDFLETTVPCMIFLDVMMPGINGLDVLRVVRTKRETHSVPVVMFSADTSPETSVSALRLGAQEFVIKGRMAFAELKALVTRYAPCADA
jgi:two-component system phosphate regulon response regulator PhoB